MSVSSGCKKLIFFNWEKFVDLIIVSVLLIQALFTVVDGEVVVSVEAEVVLLVVVDIWARDNINRVGICSEVKLVKFTIDEVWEFDTVVDDTNNEEVLDFKDSFGDILLNIEPDKNI